MKNSLSYWKQVFLFTLVTIFFVVPQLALQGTNIVTHTYAFGVRQLWAGLSPYVDPRGAGDYFKYSPFFAVLYAPYASLNRSWQAVLWGITNIALFWIGVSCWFRWSKKNSKWLWLAFLYCSMEADGSFRYQQINAALVGCLLLGLALYRDERYFLSGSLLALITNIKLIPIIFLCALIFPFRKSYILGALSGLLFCLSYPATIVGWEKNLLFHQDWYLMISQNAKGEGLLDIATIMGRYGIQNARELFLIPIGVLSCALLVFSRFIFRKDFWGPWISLGLLTLLLVSPRTESPTFVLAGPTYLFLLAECLDKKREQKAPLLLIWLAGTFLITLCMNDIWPRKIWSASSMRYANKTFGVLLLWALANLFLLIRILSKFSFSLRKRTPCERLGT